nr:MAG TPA: hypothetical protein [Caudoviricetes sp.]
MIGRDREGYIWILELGWVSNVVRPRSNSTLVVLG